MSYEPPFLEECKAWAIGQGRPLVEHPEPEKSEQDILNHRIAMILGADEIAWSKYSPRWLARYGEEWRAIPHYCTHWGPAMQAAEKSGLFRGQLRLGQDATGNFWIIIRGNDCVGSDHSGPMAICRAIAACYMSPIKITKLGTHVFGEADGNA